MASTRRVEIFQDPPTVDNAAIPMQQPSYNFSGILFENEIMLSSMTADHDIIFDPPSSASSGRSPLKTIRLSSNSPPKAVITNCNLSLPPPRPTVFRTDSPRKSTFFNVCPLSSTQKPPSPIFSSFHTSSLADKENAGPPYHGDNVAEFSDPSQGYRAPLKRAYSSVETCEDACAKRTRFEDAVSSALPDPQSFPVLEDDGNKPQISYASLIGMAILRSPERKLTLSQIYKWISDSFSHYRRAPDSGWQNSIRHNLSLNKAFCKEERPKNDPGKGHYWVIKPGLESQFVHKEKGSRRPTSSSSTSHKSLSLHLSSEENTMTSQLPPQLPPPSMSLSHANVSKEPSSDETMLASDAPSSVDEETKAMPPPAPRQHHSSPLQDIRSSPPLAPRMRQRTPSPAPDMGLPFLEQPGSRTHNSSCQEDSGYFSALDSSATRPMPDPKLPRLDHSRHKIKRGRAEEEIARMRSSSHDVSPSKNRCFMKQPTPSLVSSSPLRSLDTALMLPPLTPAVKFKLPPRAPPSVSPNTNLRIHRSKIKELVGSPIKNSTRLMSDEVSFSPAFTILETDGNYDSCLDTDFSIFNDPDADFRRPATASPPDRSLRHHDRARKTTNILSDITGTSLNKPSPLMSTRAPAYDSPLKGKSGKSPLRFGNTIDEIPQEDLFGLDFLVDEEPDDFGGLDILQGFSKIGSNKHSAAAVFKSSRPAMGSRSHTSRF